MQDIWNHPSAPEAFGYCWARNNGDVYYGIHTGTPDDGYIGSGVVFRKKYDNTDKSEWKRTIEFRGSTSECLAWEASVVTEELIKLPHVLNLVIGGNLPPKNTSNSPETRRRIASAKSKVANVYCYTTNELIAENVVLRHWAIENGHSYGSLAETARADRLKPSSRVNRRHYKGFYAEYIEEKQ